MGVRGELFSSRVLLPNRTYFFNVKENRMGDIYLNIVESKNKETGGFERQSVVLFADDLQEFLKGFDESLRVMEKAVREKRYTKDRPARSDDERRGEKPFREKKYPRSDRPEGSHTEKPFKYKTERKSGAGRDNTAGKRDKNGRDNTGRRVVVRKHDD
jgi:hypothetical protein